MTGRSQAAALTLDESVPSARAVNWRLVGIAGCTGPLIAAAFLDPRFYPLTWISWVPLFWALQNAASDREAAWAGFAAGFATNIIGFYWLTYTISVFGGFPWVLAGFFYACLTVYSSLQFVVFALGFRRIGFAWYGAAPAILWAGLEFIYPNMFAWRMANSQYHAPVLIQIGDITGPFGLSLALVWVSAALFLLWQTRRVAPLIGALAFVASIVAYGLVRMPQIEAAMRAAPTMKFALVQGSVSIEDKSNPSLFDFNVDTYRSITSKVQDQVDVVIWPETVAQWWTPADAETVEKKHHPFAGISRLLIYGGPSFRFVEQGQPPQTFNSVFLLGPPDKLLNRYDKQILMPFGEYIPGASLLPFLKSMSANTGDYNAGDSNTTFTVPGAVLGPLICYEDVVIGIPREMTRAGAQVLFNVLNDAWYGDTAGPHEHLQLALWRAIENRRYLLRSSNTGITSVVDPLGRIVAELPTFTPDVLIASVQPLSLLSFYTRYGDVFGWLLVAISAWMVVVARRR